MYHVNQEQFYEVVLEEKRKIKLFLLIYINNKFEEVEDLNE